ncbi:GNAT family N-acetyltransferase [Oceanobacillus massiliensis]|uniref:GNAT family N-acetyltransferase n=1 Tax=Oceanobacillus massiliensis TaxID=1465765 RepID=UPI0005C88579|nr:GNAT family N-acetyltransferase [Oceanobacillus massiliensis]
MEVRRWNGDEAAPLDLLLLADPSQAYIEDYLQRGQCFIAEMDNQLIGVFVLLQTRPGTVELANIAVKETEHGKGIGKQLVMYAIQIAKSSGYKSIEVGTGNSSIGQLALYQKCGFRITGIERDYFIRNYNEEIMENNIQCRDMIRLALDLQN